MTRPNSTSPLSPQRLSSYGTSNAPALRLEHVTRTHRDGQTTVTALDDVSLTVEPGELVAVMGPSGSGKSTLLNVAGTLDTPTSGTVRIGGVDVSELSPTRRAEVRRRHVGYVFQDYNLVPTLTVAENISLPLELDRVGRRDARRRALDALGDLGLTALADRFPTEVSGGQAQRVAIARGLIGDRHLVLADEPTGALDSVTADYVMELLRTRVTDGAAGLLVTHEPRFAAFADRTVHLRDGRILGGQ
ncbi:ABC transporter ATP-binding protein [uncultured Corynebacterium sp.]|uniref:ABC transporter ATP-binding protein n=1 Tax=uncultured Corynebacterium sp. TaxID=159447 RepID=UPI0025CCEB19|nr:ABC transporter ATP-binding protein [uncultured Corynebacterium sp.]